jgi:8-oxo-dGTP diphosphatase
MIENMTDRSKCGSAKDGVSRNSLLAEVLAAVFTVRPEASGEHRLQVLLWQRGQAPDAGRWALPGGVVLPEEDVDSSARRQLAAKVDLSGVAHLEQLGVFSAPDRIPPSTASRARVLAVGFLGLVPVGVDPHLPADTAWHPVDALPPTALDHGEIVERAHQRLSAKLSYTNIGFALAPGTFTLAELRRSYAAALGYEVDPTNLHRVLSRRGMLAPTGTTAAPGPSGGRPPAQFRFTVHELRVTDPFAAFRPRS